MYATYTANLTAFLTVRSQKMPFNTLEEMAAQTKYKYGLMDGTSLQGVFEVLTQSKLYWFLTLELL